MHSYVSAEGRHEVCTLCAGRAEQAGWLPADQEGAEQALRAEAERKPGFFGRMFTRTERDELPERDELDALGEDDTVEAPPPAAEATRARGEIHELETERYDVEAEWRGEDDEPSPWPSRRLLRGFFGVPRRRDDGPAGSPRGRTAGPGPTDAAPRGRSGGDSAPDGGRGQAADLSMSDLPPNGHYGDMPHGHAAHLPSPDEVPEPDHSPAPEAPAPDPHAHPAPLPDPAGRGMRPRRLQPDLSPATRFERAIARFNTSDAGRTAAGLTRTLGAPSVSVGDLAGEEDVVRVTVAWELTWYQWGVDLSDELRPVFELEKGYEVSEIDAAARQWNASAHDGRIVMVAPPRREAENGRPVHR
ncbi:MAG TPA: hypothetical protein VGI17_01310 [Solirubrobacterales bacterium]